MKTLKQILNTSCVSKTTVSLFEREDEKPFLIQTVTETKKDNFTAKIVNEEYKDYFRAQYRFLQLAMLCLV